MSMYNDNRQQHPLYREGDEPYTSFAELETHSDNQQFPASSSQIHPHPQPYPPFSRQENMNPASNRSLDPHSLTHHSVQPSPSSFAAFHHPAQLTSHESPRGWPPYQQRVSQPFIQSSSSAISVSYPPPAFPSQAPFPPTRLSPPPVHQQTHFKGQGVGPGLSHGSSNGSPSAMSNSRLTLAGSLDPATGIFYRTPEHPRLRTAQACEKCRTRKAKCSGEHPSCKRCITRGLVCEYAKEGRVRGPNKPKPKNAPAASTGGGLHGPSLVLNPEISSSTSGSGSASRNRTSSIHSSSSSETPTKGPSQRSPPKGPSIPGPAGQISMSTLGSTDFSSARFNQRRNSLSLSENRASRPRPPDLKLYETSAARQPPTNDIHVLRDNPCAGDPYLTYQQRYHDDQNRREVFTSVQLDAMQQQPLVGQQHQLHSLPHRHDNFRGRETLQMQARAQYSSGIIDHAGSVLLEPTQNHGLSSYGVEEDQLMYLPPPDTFPSHPSQLQSHQAQMSQEQQQRSYQELLEQRASAWHDASSEVFSSSGPQSTSILPMSSASSASLSSAHASRSGSAGMGVPTGSLAHGRDASSSAAGVNGLVVGGRARMLMADYSQRQLQPQVQSNSELQFALDPNFRDPLSAGALVNGAEGQVLSVCDNSGIQGGPSSQDVLN